MMQAENTDLLAILDSVRQLGEMYMGSVRVLREQGVPEEVAVEIASHLIHHAIEGEANGQD